MTLGLSNRAFPFTWRAQGLPLGVIIPGALFGIMLTGVLETIGQMKPIVTGPRTIADEQEMLQRN